MKTFIFIAILCIIIFAVPSSADYGCYCGIVSYGDNLIHSRYPWFVQIGHVINENELTIERCGGSLFTDKHILTSADCVVKEIKEKQVVIKEKLKVVIGAETAVDFDFSNSVQIKEYIIHPNYIPGKLYNNIAIIKLKHKIEFINGLNPVCLPDFEDLDNLFVYGYGGQEEPVLIKEMNDLQVISGEECESYFDQNSFNKTLTMCTVSEDSLGSADQRDPLSTKKDSQVYQVGVATIISPNQLFPSGFEKVSEHKEWIKDNTRDGLYCEGKHHPFFKPEHVLQTMIDNWVY